MLANAIENIISILVNGLFSIMNPGPVNELSAQLNAIDLSAFFSAISYFAYFVDVDIMKFLIRFELGWIVFKLAVAIALRIKSFFPTISST